MFTGGARISKFIKKKVFKFREDICHNSDGSSFDTWTFEGQEKIDCLREVFVKVEKGLLCVNL